MYSTDELIIIYMFSESEIFFPVFKIQSLQFFKKMYFPEDLKFCWEKILLYDTQIALISLKWTLNLLFNICKVLELFKLRRTMIEFLVIQGIFHIIAKCCIPARKRLKREKYHVMSVWDLVLFDYDTRLFQHWILVIHNFITLWFKGSEKWEIEKSGK